MNQHFSEVRSLVTKNLICDTFAKHFAKHFTKGEKKSTRDVRDKVSMEILWSCVKSFGKKCSIISPRIYSPNSLLQQAYI